MRLTIEKSRLTGSISIPGSKSHTIRAVAAASLAEGTSRIQNPLISSDTLSAVECYRALGAKIDTTSPEIWNVKGTGGKIDPPQSGIDVGNSGTTLRIAAGSASLIRTGHVEFTGDSQICARPISALLTALTELGASGISVHNNGCAPIRISGTLKGGKTVIECITSQYLSSLLMACPLARGDSEIEASLLYEPDYVKITLDWLDKLGIRYTDHGHMRRFTIPGGQAYRPFEGPIPADFSSATFFLGAAAIAGQDVELLGLDFTDSQPDKAVAEYLRKMGADIEIRSDSILVSAAELNGTKIDMNRTPDALPMMAVVGAFAKGTTELINVAQARRKETDRIACMAQELAKLGARTEELPDGLIIHHSPQIKAGHVDGRHDHRIVMALAAAGLALEGTTTIDTAEAMKVTFPDFTEKMNALGAKMRLRQDG